MLRWQIDSVLKKMFLLVENQKRILIKERVLRCKAEFDSTKGFSHTDTRIPETCSSRFGCQSHSISAESAPSILLQSAHKEALLRSCDGRSGAGVTDCVPSNGLVYIEGYAQPVEVGTVMPDSRVLCLDSLTSTTRYVEVQSNVAKDATEDTWIVITLSDESKFTVTEDHPIGVGSRPDGAQSSVVSAKDLVPDQHHVQSLQLRHLSVQGLERIKGSDAAIPQKATLTVRQPDRYHVLVRSSKSNAFNLHAVGSADASTTRANVKHGFLDFTTETEEDGEGPVDKSLKRSNSAPASLLFHHCSTVQQSNKQKKILHAKAWPVYEQWQNLWKEHGRCPTDPVTPRLDQSKSDFQRDFDRWVTKLKAPIPDTRRHIRL
eukprot:TRINITY_DN8689_c0_g1_i4.p1 TRINITY_DN8689_c0_g1~~TRINITY_DN8689_c0_g1_i4.p1  ORF type:complete len:376 (+),score=35.44 TRINITY_DN8689_c0_g1_i4:646-1773(+)